MGGFRHFTVYRRPTEWFALDDCEMTERGLSTPAVEQIIQSRTTPASGLARRTGAGCSP